MFLVLQMGTTSVVATYVGLGVSLPRGGIHGHMTADPQALVLPRLYMGLMSPTPEGLIESTGV